MIDVYCRNEFEKALKTIESQGAEIKKLTCQLSEIRVGLGRLRYDNNWQSVDEVNGFIDSLVVVVKK